MLLLLFKLLLDVERKSCEAGDFRRRLKGSRLVFMPDDSQRLCSGCYTTDACFAVRQLFEQHRQGCRCPKRPLNLRRALAPNLAPGATFTCVTTTWRSYAMALYNNEQHIAICCLIFDNALHPHQKLCALLRDSIESSRLTDLLNNATRHNANSPRQSPQFQESIRRLYSSRYSSHSLVLLIRL